MADDKIKWCDCEQPDPEPDVSLTYMTCLNCDRFIRPRTKKKEAEIIQLFEKENKELDEVARDHYEGNSAKYGCSE